jgi:hypothetical protein
MSKHATLIVWGIEFVSLTAIAVLLSTATNTSKWWVALPGLIIVGAKVFEYVGNARFRMKLVYYQLEILHKLLPGNGSTVRCTYHRPKHHRFRNHTELVQAFDYILQGGGGGRSFPTDKGIIGTTYNSKGPRVENFSSDHEYRERMMAEYNYTAAELMHRTADRRSYMCYPVVDENHVVLGLLYLDSDQPNTFTMDDANPRWRAVRDAGEIIRSNVLASF